LHYNPNGTIDLKEKWDNGVLKWQIFYSKGRIIKTIDENGVLKTRKGCGC
jgi:antitoxin component YwqK of YwqJK toxin-antitoxin module